MEEFQGRSWRREDAGEYGRLLFLLATEITMRTEFVCLGLALGMLPAALWADVASGPAVGTEIKSLNVEVVTGDNAGETRDYAADRADSPTIYVFLHAERFDRPTARLLRKLDEAVKRPTAGKEWSPSG